MATSLAPPQKVGRESLSQVGEYLALCHLQNQQNASLFSGVRVSRTYGKQVRRLPSQRPVFYIFYSVVQVTEALPPHLFGSLQCGRDL
jgi:hypothetical protein